MPELNRATAQSAVFMGRAYASETAHPLQRRLTFVFTDYQPNGNKQGVPRSEADNVAVTSLYMPVKINFDGEGPTGHADAEPIGPIIDMAVSDEQIVGSAIVWIDEYPAIDEYLMTASAEGGEGIQFSWELYFSESERDEAGVEWLRGITSAGICIVENPAYQGRTPLLAIAERNKMDELEAQVSALASRLYAMVDTLWAALALPGAFDRAADVEEEFQRVLETLTERLRSGEAAQSALAEANERLAALEPLEGEVAELRQFRAEVEATTHRQQVLASRREQLAAAGIVLSDDVFEQRAERLFKMTDEEFPLYVADLVEARSAQRSDKGQASLTGTSIIPDPQSPNRPTYNIAEIAAALRSTRAKTNEVA